MRTCFEGWYFLFLMLKERKRTVMNLKCKNWVSRIKAQSRHQVLLVQFWASFVTGDFFFAGWWPGPWSAGQFLSLQQYLLRSLISNVLKFRKQNAMLGIDRRYPAALPASHCFPCLACVNIRIIFAASGDMYKVWLQAFWSYFFSPLNLLFKKHSFFQIQIFWKKHFFSYHPSLLPTKKLLHWITGEGRCCYWSRSWTKQGFFN